MNELTKWKPLRELSNLRHEMDRIWDNFFSRGLELEPFRGEWIPSLDIAETADSIEVKAELPGMDPKDIQISISGENLLIKGEKKQEKEQKGKNYHRVETRYGAFTRSIRLPASVKSEDVKAVYKKGILSISLPKKEEAKPKQIPIKAE